MATKKVLIEDFMEDVAVSFLFFRNPFVFVILWLVVAAGNRSNSHVIVELADARDFWSACT